VPFVAATATLIAACVALFKEDIVKLWRRPALSLRLLLGAPDSVQMPIVVTYIYRLPEPEVPPGSPAERQGRWTGDCYFFRLWVKNSGHLAERVQVYVDSVSRQLGDGRPQLMTDFIPMNLHWSDSPPDKPIIFETINPAMGRYCDFGAVSGPTNPTESLREGMTAGESTFNLQTQVTPNTQGNRLKPGRYTIKLLVAASNAKPKAFNVTLDWSGRYMEESARMFGEGIRELTITEG
jgi:hypothetical protein